MPMPASGAARPSFRVSNSDAGIAADLQPLDHLADRAHRFDQAPERAEQAEEDQQARHVAGDVAGFIQPGSDRIQQMPHGLLGDRHPPGALAAEDRGHRRQQRRVPLDGQTGIGDAEIVDPGDLGIEPDHLPERQDDADQQHRADQGVEAGIGEEGDDDLLVQHDHHQGAQHQKHQHPHRKIRGEDNLVSSISMAERGEAFWGIAGVILAKSRVRARQYGTAAAEKRPAKRGFQSDQRGTSR